MDAQWFVEQQGKAKGPITTDQLKALALRNYISVSTRVRKGAEGPWVEAGNIRGLFEESPRKPEEKTKSPDDADLQQTTLIPARNIKVRLIFLACLLALALIASVPWAPKIFFCVSMVFLLGTFPRYHIDRHKLEREFLVAFFLVQTKSWRLAPFEAIETDLERQVSSLTMMLAAIFLGFQWVMLKLMDYIVPWFGGTYRILFRHRDGQRILAWQGNGEASFRANLDTLEEITGLPVQRR